MNAIKKTETQLEASNEVGLEVRAGKSSYVFIYGGQTHRKETRSLKLCQKFK